MFINRIRVKNNIESQTKESVVTTILFRTLIIYALLILAMRLMGKRQIGELEVSELVGTLILSEIASMPIENQEIPVSYALIPIVTITAIEIIMSVVLIKFPKLKTLISTRPSTLIENGVINQRELSRARISAEELVGELRQQSIADITEVNYAILEQNGKISVIPKADYRPATLSDMKIAASESGIMHILVSNGYINDYNMKKHNKSLDWLKKKSAEHHCSTDQIYLLLIDDNDNICLIPKEPNK